MEASSVVQAELQDKAIVEKPTVKQGTSFVFLLCFLSWSLFNSLNASFWPFFMTDVLGISAALMGTVLVSSKTLDWFLAPVAGVIVDKSNPKWGKYRSWLVLAPPAVALCYILVFTNPQISTAAISVLFVGLYAVGSIFVNLALVSLSTMIPVSSKNNADRALLSARKGQGSTLAKILFGLTALPLILMVNGGEKAAPAGYLVAAILFGVFFALMHYFLFRATKTLDASVANVKKAERVSFKEMMVGVVANPQLLLIVLSETARYICQMTIMGLAAYYFGYVFGNMALMAAAFTAMNIVGFLGTVTVEFLTKKIDKRTVYIMGIAITLAALIIAWLVGKTPLIYTVCLCLAFYGMNFMNGTQLALQSDTLLYGEWKTGTKSKAFLMSVFQWCPKLGNIVSGAVVGFGLAAIGYVEDMEVTAAFTSGMNNIINLLPALFMLIALGLIVFLYKLNTRTMVKIQADLASRESAA